MFMASYTYLDQKSTALDTGNSSLGGITYNPFQPDSDYGIDGYISHHRFVAYGIYDLPVGKRAQIRRQHVSCGRLACWRLANHIQHVRQVWNRLHSLLDLR